MSERIAVAMSGGVDSSVAAALLAEAGHDVVGVTLQLWDYSEANLAEGKGRCCSPADIADARAVAAQVDFPHYVFDHTEHFREQIVEPFLDDYTAGLTPSPCISCNRHVKFDLLWRMAEALGATRLATGHYVRIEDTDDRPRIHRAVDKDKDQSYFLFDVPRAQLGHVMFPLGHLDKNEVRDHARRLGLTVADKPESFELCFIPDGDKDEFINRERPQEAGRPVSISGTDGERMGTASGLHRYTIGQRKGLGVSSSQRLYVLDVAPETDTIVVGAEDGLYSSSLTAVRCNWVAIEAPTESLRVQAKIRHRHTPAEATLQPNSDGTYDVRFDDEQRAVTPGQGVAFYDHGLLLGGGWIARATP
ncbi:MAG: tRNA 2-thiouridine(34) synthase MnmA [Acidobacteria bacterium]|nr:tRNA 2-thiouridine(34) synthase MnmA [Acidobacteriota bacterium]